MKVKEVIEILSKLNQDADVYAAIRQYNKEYPVAYEEIFDVQQCGDRRVWLYTSLPENIYTVKKKRELL